jgi:ribosomal protein S18 acetylase RimI-like enzyme
MAIWRPMTANDIQAVLRVADKVHPDLPENDTVFAERARLFPEGSLVLVKDGEVCGYVTSHPIQKRQPPALNSLLGEIASTSDQYYIHDLAILPKMRSKGHAITCMDKVLAVAKRYPTTCLISVYGTAPFWEKFGFVAVQADVALVERLSGYGDDAVYLEYQNPS